MVDAIWVLFGLAVVAGFIVAVSQSVKIVRPLEKGVVERLGKFNSLAEPGLVLLVPFVDRMIKVPTTEIRVDVAQQVAITKDNLNTVVDAIVYYKINDVQKALYAIDEYESAIPSLAQTTLRAVIGKMTLSEVNENRHVINSRLEDELDKETQAWGIDIIRVELQRIEPPGDVQQAMNNVVKAENERIAATNLSLAAEINADGLKKAAIKNAEGSAQAIELQANAQAKAIQVVNEAAQKYFRGEAQVLKRLEVAEKAMSRNTKYVVPSGADVSVIISDAAGVTPINSGASGKGKK